MLLSLKYKSNNGYSFKFKDNANDIVLNKLFENISRKYNTLPVIGILQYESFEK